MQVRSLPQPNSKMKCQTRGVCLTLVEPEHQEMNGQVEVNWRTLRTVAHSIMVHARVPEVYVNFTLMYTTNQIFPVLPIKDLINEDGDLTTPHKIATGTKPSVHIYTCYFVYVLYEKLRRTLRQRRQTCVIKCKKGFAVSSLGFQSIIKDILCTYPLQER